jgi:polyhydroxyalkanoate synthase
VKFIVDQTHGQKINLLGICQGGLICTCYAALSSEIKNLVLISTPIDFHTPDNTVAKFLNRIDMDAFVEVYGNVPGVWLTQFFISLRPFELVGKKYLRFISNLQNQQMTDRFIQVEKWLNDAPNQPGAAFAEMAREFYKENKLLKGEIRIDGQKIDLAKLTMPILNVMASEDEIVPMSASQVLKKYVSHALYFEKIFPSGHIGIYVSDKVGDSMSKAIAEWLKEHENLPSSPTLKKDYRKKQSNSKKQSA